MIRHPPIQKLHHCNSSPSPSSHHFPPSINNRDFPWGAVVVGRRGEADGGLCFDGSIRGSEISALLQTTHTPEFFPTMRFFTGRDHKRTNCSGDIDDACEFTENTRFTQCADPKFGEVPEVKMLCNCLRRHRFDGKRRVKAHLSFAIHLVLRSRRLQVRILSGILTSPSVLGNSVIAKPGPAARFMCLDACTIHPDADSLRL